MKGNTKVSSGKDSSRNSSGLTFTQPDELSEIKSYFIRLLSRREYSAKELMDKAAQKFDKQELFLTALAYIQELGYQSDERFTKSIIRSQRSSGYGDSRIRLKLKEKGIHSDLYNDLMNAELSDATERAFEVWEKKFKVWSEDFKAQAKYKRFLLYRGFSFQEVNSVLDQAKSQALNYEV